MNTAPLTAPKFILRIDNLSVALVRSRPICACVPTTVLLG